MNTLYKKSLTLSFALFAVLLSFNVYSQCTECTLTYANGSSGRVDLNGNQRVCITGNSSMSLGNINGSNNKLCIAPGVTWNTSTTMFSGMVIDVYGTMKASNMGGNGNMIINIHENGKLEFSGSNIPRDFTINNSGTIELTNNGNIAVQAKINNQTPNARILAKAGDQTLLQFQQNMVDNYGIMDVMNLENSDTKGFENRASGQIIIQGIFYQHGILSNRGTIETQCGVTRGVNGLMPCGMLVGDKGAKNFKIEGGTINVKGNLTVNGQVNMEGGRIIVSGGDVNINKPVTGSGGFLKVTDGTAQVNNGGSFGNTNRDNPDMTLFVGRTTNHDFNSIAPSQNGNFYKINGDSSLPVTLVTFTASRQENQVLIDWTTSEESNSDKFEIEKSIDAKNWKKIGEKTSNNSGVANSNYTFSDSNIQQTTYYRLKMVDLDGSFAYSNIRSVWVGQVAESFIYPNPASDKFFIRSNDTDAIKKIFIYDLSGKVVLTPTLQENAIDVQSLPTGQYLIRVLNADGSMKTYKSSVSR